MIFISAIFLLTFFTSEYLGSVSSVVTDVGAVVNTVMAEGIVDVAAITIAVADGALLGAVADVVGVEGSRVLIL